MKYMARYLILKEKMNEKNFQKIIILGIIAILLPLIINKTEPLAKLLVYNRDVDWNILIGSLVVFLLLYYTLSCLALKSNMEDDKTYIRIY